MTCTVSAPSIAADWLHGTLPHADITIAVGEGGQGRISEPFGGVKIPAKNAIQTTVNLAIIVTFTPPDFCSRFAHAFLMMWYR